MRNQIRKKAQRRINQTIRNVNKSVCKDDLWRGRFEVRQKAASWESFEDGSGGKLQVTLRFYDKKNDYYKDWITSVTCPSTFSFFTNDLCLRLNEFIINDCGVWEESPSPREEGFVKDYSKQYISDEVMSRECNYFLPYQSF